MIKKIESAMVALVLALTLAVPAFAVEGAVFSDVTAGAWYAESVDYVRNNGLMGGTSDTTFSPGGTMTRSMLATVLYRAAGSPAISGVPDFSDVASDAYYSDAVVWASENSIVSGYGNGLFGADDPVSREQISAILWRCDGSETADSNASFTDSASISGYAVQAVDWAVEKGIVTGQTDGSFNPAGNATRAQVAVMLHRYLTREETPKSPEQQPSGQGRVLIAFFSRAGENYGVGTVEKGNTQYVAEFITQETGGTLFHVETETPYPVSYDETTAIAQQEQEDDARPVLVGAVENMEQYDTVFLGYPIWYGDMPMAMYTFLEAYDFSGKTIIPFSTHAGSGFGSSISTLRELCPGATLLDGFTVAGTQASTSQAAVNNWLDGLNLPESGAAEPTADTTQITMTVGDAVITATLTDSQTTRDFLALLPRTLTLSRYGDREYYGNPGGVPSVYGESIPDFTNGDVTFYPPSGNLAIFFGNEDTSNQSGLIRMGRITSDLSVLDDFGQTIEMTIAIAE